MGSHNLPFHELFITVMFHRHTHHRFSFGNYYYSLGGAGIGGKMGEWRGAAVRERKHYSLYLRRASAVHCCKNSHTNKNLHQFIIMHTDGILSENIFSFPQWLICLFHSTFHKGHYRLFCPFWSLAKFCQRNTREDSLAGGCPTNAKRRQFNRARVWEGRWLTWGKLQVQEVLWFMRVSIKWKAVLWYQGLKTLDIPVRVEKRFNTKKKTLRDFDQRPYYRPVGPPHLTLCKSFIFETEKLRPGRRADLNQGDNEGWVFGDGRRVGVGERREEDE